MRVWIDNTGLDAVGLCLEGTARGDYDIKGLLQFATLLVFSDQLKMNGFEEEKVAERTVCVRQALIKLGLEENALIITPPILAPYALACREAASSSAEALGSGRFRPDLMGVSMGAAQLVESVDVLPRAKAALERWDDLVINRAKVPKTQLEQIASKALWSDRATGAVAYMLASSEQLFEAVRALPGFDIRSHDHVYQLNGFLRCHLNEALAGDDWLYAPAVPRAEIGLDRRESVIQSLSEIVDAATDDLAKMLGKPTRTGAVRLPAVEHFLVSRAGGCPDGIIKEALELRKDTKPLREWLSHHLIDTWQSRVIQDEPAFTSHEIEDKEIEAVLELVKPLRQQLGLLSPGPPKPEDAFTFTIALGIPPVKLGMDIPKFKKFVMHRWQHPRIAAMANIAAKAAYLPVDGPYKTLQEKSRENYL
jgi:hypothetical protein